jgi:hypothetical protein
LKLHLNKLKCAVEVCSQSWTGAVHAQLPVQAQRKYVGVLLEGAIAGLDEEVC